MSAGTETVTCYGKACIGIAEHLGQPSLLPTVHPADLILLAVVAVSLIVVNVWGRRPGVNFDCPCTRFRFGRLFPWAVSRSGSRDDA